VQSDPQLVIDQPNYNLIDPDLMAVGIRGRGNDTWGQPKKPYRIRFAEKHKMFGLTKAKSWVLLANYRDPTLLMNAAAFELGKRLDLAYQNNYVHVELFLNNVYVGNYVLTEQVQVNKGRVNIDVGTPGGDDGFLALLDVYTDEAEDYKFTTTSYGIPITFKAPEELADVTLYNNAKNLINAFDAALYNGGAAFPETGGYRDYIDMESFAKFLMANEMVYNGELGHPKSTYMYKDKDGKISMGPLWDFDWAYGYSSSYGWTGYFNNPTYELHISSWRTFFRRFYDDNAPGGFKKTYKAIWQEKYDAILDMGAFIEAMGNKLEKSYRLNLTYCNTLNSGYPDDIAPFITAMKNWWLTRAAYLNSVIAGY